MFLKILQKIQKNICAGLKKEISIKNLRVIAYPVWRSNKPNQYKKIYMRKFIYI